MGVAHYKVGMVAKIFARFARNYTYNTTILKILDPPLNFSLSRSSINICKFSFPSFKLRNNP